MWSRQWETAEHGLKQAFASDLALVKIHEYWLNLAIDLIKKSQDVNVRVKWGDEAGAREVITRRKRELRVEDPEDEIMDDYGAGETILEILH